jgi:hypothetical protein
MDQSFAWSPPTPQRRSWHVIGARLLFSRVGVTAIILLAVGAMAVFRFLLGLVDGRQEYVFLHNPSGAPAEVTLDGTPLGTIEPWQSLRIDVEPRRYLVQSRVGGRVTQGNFEVPRRASFFDGLHAIYDVTGTARYGVVTARYGTAADTTVRDPDVLGRLVRIPHDVEGGIDERFPDSVSVRRGYSRTIRRVCLVLVDGSVPCVD